jgi:pyocin large subunit-like protein
MSVEAITWALKQPVPKSSAKFVLVALANCANAEHGTAFPSIGYLCEATAQDRKTIIANLSKLVEWRLIEDTGERAGRTRQIIVYRVLMAATLLDQTIPKSERFQKRNSPVSPSKESRFSVETVPKTGHGTVINRNGTSVLPARANPTDAGTACRLMREAGCMTTNPSHPDLIAALAEGVTPEALADTVREALQLGKPKPFPWAIATARGRQEEGAKPMTGANNANRPQRSRLGLADRNPRPAFDDDGAIIGQAVRVHA